MSTSVLTKQQYKSMGPKPVKGYGDGAAIWAHIRYDDECGNGHNSFAITGTVRVPRHREPVAGGCLHDEIAEAFPELAPLIKWHLCASDGPMYYISNTVFLAGERDCWGKLKGEPRQWETHIQFGKNPIKHKLRASFAKFLQDARSHPGAEAFDFEVIRYDHDNRPGETYKFAPKYTFGGYASKWHECPFDTEQEALDFLTALKTCDPQFIKIATAWGEGKERELDSARHTAIWPEATDEELTAPGLKERLEARLPKLMEDFKAAIESLGFVY
jgi:hypothetical protein